MTVKDVKLVHTAFAKNDLIRDSHPQVIFLGRSNVGKSTLINSLLGRKKLARTSSTPGKTVSINYYLVNGCFYFVDLPGYGYAKISRTERERVKDLMSRFFRDTPRPALVLLLIDSRRGFLDHDLEVLAKILPNSPKILTVLTKSDKISSSLLAAQVKKYQKQFELYVVPFSVKSRQDREEIWRNIEGALDGYTRMEDAN